MEAPHLSFDEACAELDRTGRFGVNPSLDTITQLAEELGRPQDGFRCIQVAGTNGKGSTARVVAAVLGEHGVDVGTFLSPHMHDYREDISFGSRLIEPELFAQAVSAAVGAAQRASDRIAEPPTQFELLTAAALWVLREREVEAAVLEVGLGGRWDSTSVVRSEVAAITSVALDHVELLGPTVRDVAWDKAHVIKAGTVGVLGPDISGTRDVFAARAREAGGVLVPLARASDAAAPASCLPEFALVRRQSSPVEAMVVDVRTSRASYADLEFVGPAYQAGNLACGVVAAEEFLGVALDDAAVRRALRTLRVPGRFEVLAGDPWVIVDGAHNPAGASALAEAVGDALPGRGVTLVIGVLADKDARGILVALAGIAVRTIVTSPDVPRAMPTATLAQIAREVTGTAPVVEPDLQAAIRIAVGLGDPVVVAGSLTVVAGARAAYGRTI